LFNHDIYVPDIILVISYLNRLLYNKVKGGN